MRLLKTAANSFIVFAWPFLLGYTQQYVEKILGPARYQEFSRWIYGETCGYEAETDTIIVYPRIFAHFWPDNSRQMILELSYERRVR